MEAIKNQTQGKDLADIEEKIHNIKKKINLYFYRLLYKKGLRRRKVLTILRKSLCHLLALYASF
jgi:hypothetical protein